MNPSFVSWCSAVTRKKLELTSQTLAAKVQACDLGSTNQHIWTKLNEASIQKPEHLKSRCLVDSSMVRGRVKTRPPGPALASTLSTAGLSAEAGLSGAVGFSCYSNPTVSGGCCSWLHHLKGWFSPSGTLSECLQYFMIYFHDYFFSVLTI